MSGASNRPYVWLIVANADSADGIAGISVGVDWAMVQHDPGESLQVAWTRCAELESPSGGWPQSGGGNRIIIGLQTTCKRMQPTAGKVTACAGFFYLTSYYDYLIEAAYIRLTKNFDIVPAELWIAYCDATEDDLPATRLGWVGINPNPSTIRVPGCNPYIGPCDKPVATKATTWGKVKTFYTPKP